MQRLTLWNQYEILKIINPKASDECEVNQEILANGYEKYYLEINLSIDKETLPPEMTREVEEILNVFRLINFSSRKLRYKPKSDWATFRGFDANDGGGQYGFACFVRCKLGKWEELEDCPDNSHSGTSLPHYRRMLETWRRLGSKSELSSAEIEEIAEAQ